MKIAICICTYKRTKLLERLLRSLRYIQLPEMDAEDIRVIVVDNNPDGQARAVCDRLAGLLPMKLVFAEENQQGISFARNRAIDEALCLGADCVAFIDDDDLPEPDWLLHLIEKGRATGANIVCGVIHPIVDAKLPEWFKKSPLFDAPSNKSQTKFGVPRGIGTGNVLIDRKLLERLKTMGPVFSPEFALIVDTEFFVRAQRQGATFARAEKSTIQRNFSGQRQTLKGLLRYAFRLGNYSMLLLKKHGTIEQIARRRRKVFKKIPMDLLKLPFFTFSSSTLVRNLYNLSKELGMLYRYFILR